MIVEVTTFQLADADGEAAFLEVDRRVQVEAMGCRRIRQADHGPR